MVFSVVELDLHIHDREPAEHPVLKGLDYALFNARYVLFRYGAAEYSFLELETRSPRPRGHADEHLSELAVSARLLFMTVIGVRFFCYGLAVRHPRLPDFDLDLVF